MEEKAMKDSAPAKINFLNMPVTWPMFTWVLFFLWLAIYVSSYLFIAKIEYCSSEQFLSFFNSLCSINFKLFIVVILLLKVSLYLKALISFSLGLMTDYLLYPLSEASYRSYRPVLGELPIMWDAGISIHVLNFIAILFLVAGILNSAWNCLGKNRF